MKTAQTKDEFEKALRGKGMDVVFRTNDTGRIYSINRQDTSTSINTQMDSLIPASKISNLTQGWFVGAVSDNFDERIEQKIFHAEIVVDIEKVNRETAKYKKNLKSTVSGILKEMIR